MYVDICFKINYCLSIFKRQRGYVTKINQISLIVTTIISLNYKYFIYAHTYVYIHTYTCICAAICVEILFFPTLPHMYVCASGYITH